MNTVVIGSNKKENTALEKLLSSVSSFTVLKSFDQVREGVAFLTKHTDAALFISGELLGDNTAQIIERLPFQPSVVVFSTNSESAASAFEIGAVDFILLPNSADRLKKTMKRLEIITAKKKDFTVASGFKDMYVRSNAKSLRVSFSDVLFIEAMADYVIIHTEGFKYIVHYTMKGIQDKLPTDIFVRAHRSYIVNLEKIHAIDNQEIIIKDKRIPIGGSTKDYFFSRLNLI
jgi:two-component system, LytTR family, response regulator